MGEWCAVDVADLGPRPQGEGKKTREARSGWTLKTITAVDVKGRIGPGGVEGVLVVFERPE